MGVQLVRVPKKDRFSWVQKKGPYVVFWISYRIFDVWVRMGVFVVGTPGFGRLGTTSRELVHYVIFDSIPRLNGRLLVLL